MSFGNYFGLLDMYPDVDRWLSTIGGNMAGTPMSGHRATRTTFQGSLGSFSPNRVGGGKPNVSSNPTLNPTTELDQTQGQLSATGRDTDYAIQGQGYFLLEDAKGNFYLTRNGEFKRDDLGQLNAGNGLHVVTRTRLLQLGIISPTVMNATNRVALVDRGEAGWQRAQAVTVSGQNAMWFPYVAGTAYEDAALPGTYAGQSVAFKRTFDLGSNPINPTSANSFITVRSDDWSHVYINGSHLGVADVISSVGGGTTFNADGPTSGLWLGYETTFDISKYLRPGLNTITSYSSEVYAGEGVQLSGQINGQAVSVVGAQANQWWSKILGTNVAGGTIGNETIMEPEPTDERLDRLFERGIDDLAIVNFPDASKLQYSRYGTNYLEITPAAGKISYEFSSADAANGKIKRGFREASNTTIQTEMSELSMAQRMYQAVTGLANLQMKAFQRSIDLIQ